LRGVKMKHEASHVNAQLVATTHFVGLLDNAARICLANGNRAVAIGLKFARFAAMLLALEAFFLCQHFQRQRVLFTNRHRLQALVAGQQSPYVPPCVLGMQGRDIHLDAREMLREADRWDTVVPVDPMCICKAPAREPGREVDVISQFVHIPKDLAFEPGVVLAHAHEASGLVVYFRLGAQRFELGSTVELDGNTLW